MYFETNEVYFCCDFYIASSNLTELLFAGYPVVTILGVARWPHLK